MTIKIGYRCKYCGSVNLKLVTKGTHINIYCADCNKFLKRASKEDITMVAEGGLDLLKDYENKCKEAPTVYVVIEDLCYDTHIYGCCLVLHGAFKSIDDIPSEYREKDGKSVIIRKVPLNVAVLGEDKIIAEYYE